jgi:hypothetical protein
MKGLFLKICLGFILFYLPLNIYASEILEINPQEQLVKETDIGKTFDISIKNTSDQKIQLEAKEVRLNKQAETVSEVEEGKQVLEMAEKTIQIEPGATFTHKIRIKFSSQDFNSNYPAVKYLSTNSGEDLSYKVEDLVVFLIQNLDGEYKMGLDVSLANQDITTSNEIKLTVTVRNDGSKYFKPSGNVVIYYKDKPVFEEDLAEKLDKRLFTGEETSIELTHNLEDTSWQAVGEYRVELKINSDYSANQKIAEISFIYVPVQLITYTGIIIGSVVLISIITYLFKRGRKKQF